MGLIHHDKAADQMRWFWDWGDVSEIIEDSSTSTSLSVFFMAATIFPHGGKMVAVVPSFLSHVAASQAGRKGVTMQSVRKIFLRSY